jgi:universal stress protein E
MRVLYATDLLPKSDASMERAALLAEQLGAELSVLHVVPPTETERALEQELSLAIGQIKLRTRAPMWHHTVKPDVIVKTGSPAQRIIETIGGVDADLVVLGPHRKRGLRGALAGTIAERVLKSRKAPVLLARATTHHPYQKVVLALDLSPLSADVLRTAEGLVVSPDSSVTIVHASEPPYEGMLLYAGLDESTVGTYRLEWTEQAEASIGEFLEQESAHPARYRIAIDGALPAKAILHAARRLRPQLLVLGTHGRGPIGRALLGSVANEVLREAQCDVLIVPNGSTRPATGRSIGAREVPRRVPERASL